MSWSSVLTATYIRQVSGLLDSSYDTELDFYIQSILEDLQIETGINIDADPTTPASITIKNSLRKNRFVLDNSILQSGAWQSITNIEIAEIQPTPIWETLVESRDYSLIEHTAKPYPYFQVKFTNFKVRENQMIRITGLEGFSLDSNIPKQILVLLTTAVSAYYNYLASGGLANGSQMVSEEASLTRRVKISDTALNTWKSPKLFSPLQIAEFEKIINKYNVFPFYPY